MDVRCVSVQGLRGFANEKKVWIGGLPAGPTSIETNKKLKEHMAQAERLDMIRKLDMSQSPFHFGDSKFAYFYTIFTNCKAPEYAIGRSHTCCMMCHLLVIDELMMNRLLQTLHLNTRSWKHTKRNLCPFLLEAGECIFAEINKSGIAGAAYKTPEEVQKAVQMLNGSTFEGHTLEVDVWQKKTPEAAAWARRASVRLANGSTVIWQKMAPTKWSEVRRPNL